MRQKNYPANHGCSHGTDKNSKSSHVLCFPNSLSFFFRDFVGKILDGRIKGLRHPNERNREHQQSPLLRRNPIGDRTGQHRNCRDCMYPGIVLCAQQGRSPVKCESETSDASTEGEATHSFIHK